jgi:plastocyanin
MRQRQVVSVTLLTLGILGMLVSRGTAGPEKITFPANWKEHVLYTTVDRYDTKQYRELYASSAAAVEAMKAGKPLPDGTVLTLVQYKAAVDAGGNPEKDSRGRFVKGDLIAFTVMEKRAGWGAEYPTEWRNGEWEYAAFNAAGVLNDKANYKACFECHKPHEKMDYVISLAAVRAMGGAPAAAATPNADVNIMGFAFGPAKISVDAGKPVTWVNGDESPHQISVASTKARSPILTKGQSTAMTFATAGTYDYACGLHPSMKGTVEVK